MVTCYTEFLRFLIYVAFFAGFAFMAHKKKTSKSLHKHKGHKHIEGKVYKVEMTLLTVDFKTRSPTNDERLSTEG